MHQITKATAVGMLALTLLLFSAPGHAKKNILLSAYQPDTAPTLKASQGYLLLKLDINGVAPSLEFIQLTNKADIHAKPKKQKRKPLQVNLKGLDNGYYVLPLKAGLYQIVKVNAPYFGLPYWVDTAEDHRWRFVVNKQKTNYIGTLNIAKDREEDYVAVRLYNRLARDKNSLASELNKLLTVAPLSPGFGYRDDFYQDVYHHE